MQIKKRMGADEIFNRLFWVMPVSARSFDENLTWCASIHPKAAASWIHPPLTRSPGHRGICCLARLLLIVELIYSSAEIGKPKPVTKHIHYNNAFAVLVTFYTACMPVELTFHHCSPRSCVAGVPLHKSKLLRTFRLFSLLVCHCIPTVYPSTVITRTLAYWLSFQRTRGTGDGLCTIKTAYFIVFSWSFSPGLLPGVF